MKINHHKPLAGQKKIKIPIKILKPETVTKNHQLT